MAETWSGRVNPARVVYAHQRELIQGIVNALELVFFIDHRALAVNLSKVAAPATHKQQYTREQTPQVEPYVSAPKTGSQAQTGPCRGVPY